MSEEKDIFDLIERYLKDELERDELDRFRNRIRNEPDFAREVELHRAMVESINDVRKSELRAYIKENAKFEYIGNIWGNTWLYASAAVVVIMVGLFFVVRNMDTGKMLVNKESSEEQVADGQKPSSRRNKAHAVLTDSAGLDESSNATSEKDSVVTEWAFKDQPGEPNGEYKAESYRDLAIEEMSLEASGIEDSLVKTDKLIASSEYTVTVISFNDPMGNYLKNADKVAVTPSEQEEVKEKRKGLLRKSKSEDDEDAATVPQTAETERLTSTKSLDVEFWSSPVNFKGYKYDGKTVQLYGVGANESIRFAEYNNQLYLKRNGQYFVISNAPDYRKFSKLNDAAIIKELNK